MPAAAPSALPLFIGSGTVTSASRNVTVAGRSFPPKARMRNFVITPSTGAPPE